MGQYQGDYIKEMQEIGEYVEGEIPGFKSLTPERKIQRLTANLKIYCEVNNTLNTYMKWSKGSDKYKGFIEEKEYQKKLSETRLLKKIPHLDEYELKLYVIHLNTKFQKAKIEKDIKKRFFMYDYIMAGCRVCNVENEEIMQEISGLRERCSELIKEIPTM